MKNPRDAQHTENDKTGQEESRNDRKQVNDAIKRDQKFQPGARLAHAWIKEICSPDTEHIFNAENEDGNGFYHRKHTGKWGKLLKCLHECDQNIADDRDRNKNIKSPAQPVAFVTNLNDIKYFFSHGKPLTL